MNRTKRILTLLVLFTATFAAGPAFAEYLPANATQADQVDSVDLMRQYLGSQGYVASRLELRQLSGDGVGDLVEIIDGRASDTVKARAIEALALYRGDGRVVQTLDALIDDTRPTSGLFPSVLMAFAQVNGEAGVATIEQFADHDRADVRMGAVVALGRFGGQAGFELLHELAQSEEDPQVLARISAYVR